jgi:hypothetical protein
MADQQQPLSPWTMTPARITLLVLGILAILMIIGGIFGGVANYQLLSQSVSSSASAADAPSSSQAP